MKIFLSWSKDRSKKVALLLSNWLQCVVQSSEPWMSDIDIERGALWINDINGNLNSSATGIICLTKSNLSEPWILFEAGALSKGLETNRVCCLLIDLEPSDILGPLSQFNHTKPIKNDMKKLVYNLNERSERILSPQILEQVFETHWDRFEKDFNNIIEETEATGNINLPKIEDRDILYEILNSTRLMNNRITSLENISLTSDSELSDELKTFVSYSNLMNLQKSNSLLFKNKEYNDNIKNETMSKKAYRTKALHQYNISKDNNEYFNK